MRWFRGIRDGAALVRLAVKKSPQPVIPKVFYLDPEYEKTPGMPLLKRSTVVPYTLPGMGCGVIFIVWILFMTYVFGYGAWQDYVLSTQGQETGAVSTRCSRAKTGYTVSYTYTARVNGVMQEFRGSGKSVTCFQAGARLSVWYLPHDPSVSRPASESTSLHDMTLIALCLGCVSLYFITAMIGGVLRHLRGRRRYRRLLSNGVVLPGKVIQGRWTHSPTQIEIEYEFTAPDGAILRGTQAHARGNFPFDVPVPGTPVQIIYADANTHVML